MGRPRRLVFLLGATAVALAAVQHVRGATTGHRVPGGILIGDTAIYDVLSRLLLGPFFGRIAADVAAVAPDGARVLEVGCGAGSLSIRLVRQHDLEVTGLDLDPVMIARARANADRSRDAHGRQPAFLVGDVAALAFPDGSFDLVVSTLSMHHWADPTAGLAETGRVLRSGGRALVWDLRPGVVPFHAHVLDRVEHTRGAPLRVVRAAPWRWPWRFPLTQRIERAGPRRRLTRVVGKLERPGLARAGGPAPAWSPGGHGRRPTPRQPQAA